MLCLNMIVKNESARIERALKSVEPYITSYVILDTGSTDGTKECIRKVFDGKVPGTIYDGEFKNFEQARNDALRLARGNNHFYAPKMFLLMDADMELKVNDPLQFMEPRQGMVYEMYQHAGAVHYTNARLLNANASGWYKGVTHEYLDVPSAGRIPESVAYFIDHADGSNRGDKCERDIRLLLQGLKDEPDNARYMYYLASSYRDDGQHAYAAHWYKRRMEAGGWDEEVWQAHVSYAHSLKEMGRRHDFIATMLDAYSRRPWRAEAMYDLARWYREQTDKQAAALACAEAVEHLPKPNDTLFVNDYVYSVGIKEEIAIAAAYVPGKLEKGRRYNDELALQKTEYWTARSCARANTYWYTQKLGDLCPSFKWQNIPYTPPDGLTPMNPSVCMLSGDLYVNVRAVNYRIDEHGRYLIKASDGTANRENPIDTRNFLVRLGGDPFGEVEVAKEIYRPGNMPVEFPLVTGFEDLRLIPRDDGLWGSATVRQLHEDGNCEQVVSRIGVSDGECDAPYGYVHTDIRRMLRQPRETEKNWAPILMPNVMPDSAPLFMHRPGHVVGHDGNTIVQHEVPIMVDNISGSSQVIPWEGLWLAVTHTAHPLPNEPYKRYYFHRFIEYTNDFKIRRLSMPFVFNGRVIEFCAGMCMLDEDTLCLSYGYKDEEARIATVSASEVRRLLRGGHSYAG